MKLKGLGKGIDSLFTSTDEEIAAKIRDRSAGKKDAAPSPAAAPSAQTAKSTAVNAPEAEIKTNAAPVASAATPEKSAQTKEPQKRAFAPKPAPSVSQFDGMTAESESYQSAAQRVTRGSAFGDMEVGNSDYDETDDAMPDYFSAVFGKPSGANDKVASATPVTLSADGMPVRRMNVEPKYVYQDLEEGFVGEDNSPRERSDGNAMLVPLTLIDPNPDQPRKYFDKAALDELAESIKEHGIIQPLTLAKRGKRYMIIAGERRYQAAKLAGITYIPCVIRPYNEAEIAELALIENLQREDLNPVETAEGIKELMRRFDLTQEEISKKIGKSRPVIANLLRILNLNPEVIDMVRDGRLSSGHARCLVTVENKDRQTSLAVTAVREQMSVRELERLANENKPIFAEKAKARREKKQAETLKSNLELRDLVRNMERILGTRVSAIGNENRGRITIDYFDSEDIDRIYRIFEKLK